VYAVLESTSKSIEEIEADKYLNKENRNLIIANSDKPSLTTIQQVEDSGTQRQIIYSKNIVEKIFQPFFTTKPTGKGTGLGLSLAYDIVKAHGGDLEVKTAENEGTTFTIRLPLH